MTLECDIYGKFHTNSSLPVKAAGHSRVIYQLYTVTEQILLLHNKDNMNFALAGNQTPSSRLADKSCTIEPPVNA